MPATTNTPPANAAEQPSAPDFCAALFQVLRGTKSKEELYRHAVRAIAVHFDSPYASLQADSSTGAFEETVQWNESDSGAWKRPSDGFLLSARSENVAKAKLYQTAGTDNTFAVMAVPLPDGPSRVVGSIVVVTRCNSKELAEARLTELKALVGTVNAMAAGIMQVGSAPAKGADVSATGVAKASQYNTLSEFSFAIANNLKRRFPRSLIR